MRLLVGKKQHLRAETGGDKRKGYGYHSCMQVQVSSIILPLNLTRFSRCSNVNPKERRERKEKELPAGWLHPHRPCANRTRHSTLAYTTPAVWSSVYRICKNKTQKSAWHKLPPPTLQERRNCSSLLQRMRRPILSSLWYLCPRHWLFSRKERAERSPRATLPTLHRSVEERTGILRLRTKEFST